MPGIYNGNNLQWRLEKANARNPDFAVGPLLEQSRDAAWCAVVDGSELYINSNGSWPDETEKCMNYDVFYSVNFLRREFPKAVMRPPVEGHMQHCCLIRG